MTVDPAQFYGRKLACACGKTHVIEPQKVVYAAELTARLPGLCAEVCAPGEVVVLCDARTREVGGQAAVAALQAAGWRAREFVLPDPAPGHEPVCDDLTKDWLRGRLGSPELILPVGSGVVSDLAKWLSHELGRPYLCVGTAASMNGYASANVAPRVGGVKTLVRAAPPRIVAAEPGVIEKAPWRLTSAGLGDILAKSVSSADWRLNHLIFGDYFCRAAVDLIAGLEPLYLERPEGLAAGEPRAVEALFQGLLLTGVAMTMAESSAPASGGEHLVSHSLDMLADRDGIPHDLHGRQVGVGTILAAALYERLLATESPEWRPAPEAVDREFWGSLADGVTAYYAKKSPRRAQALAWLRTGGNWDRLRSDLAGFLRPAARIRDCLRRAGAAWRAEEIGCERTRLVKVLNHAHELRDRFTGLDLAYLAGLLPGAAEELVAEWVV